MRSSWIILTFAFVVTLISIALAGAIMLTGGFQEGLNRTELSDLGIALIGGALVGLALLGAEMAYGIQLQRLEAERQQVAERERRSREEQAEREGLRLQLGLGKEFPQIDLRGKNLMNFYLTERNFSRANFSGANLARVNLTNADLTYANLAGANLAGATLVGANLEGADLAEADLSNSTLWGANLKSSNLICADLRGVDPISIGHDHLSGATYSIETQWPSGYTPSGEPCNDLIDEPTRHPSNPNHWHHS